MDKPKTKPIELRPDAWERSERAVDIVAKSPPRPRSKTDQKARKKRKPRQR